MNSPDASISDALAPSSGARFYKCALQVNPFAYLQRHNKPTSFTSEGAYNAAIVGSCHENGIEVIAVTDHYNIKSSVALMEACRSEGILAFPGFEAKTKDGVHFLCLFDMNTDIEEIDRKIGDCGIHSPRDAASTGTHDVLEFLDRSAGWGAVCIGAHATTGGGLLGHLSKEPRINAWKSERLLAVSIANAISDEPAKFRDILLNKNPEYRRDNPVAVVNARDVDDPADLAEKGTSCSIKMSTVSIEGLRQAFLDQDSRVWLHSDPLPPPHSSLVAIKWTGGFLDGTSVRFSQDLNVLIGGRGVGKSTIIESVRYVLGLKPTSDEVSRSHNGIVRHVLRDGTKVSLLVNSTSPSERQYAIERTVPNPPVVKTADGGRETLSPDDVFSKIEIFGQREIGDLTESGGGLTRLLEKFLGSTSSSVDNEATLRHGLKQNREALLAATRDAAAIRERLAQLPGLEERYERFRDAGLEKRLRERSLLVREERLLESVAEHLDPIATLVSRLGDELPIDQTFLSPRAMESLPGAPIFEPLKSTLSTLSRSLDGSVRDMREAMGRARGEVEEVTVRWQSRQADVKLAAEQTLRELGEGAVQGGEFIQLRQQIERLRPLQSKLEAAESAEREHRMRRRKLIEEWEEVKATRIRRLARAAKHVSGRLSPRVEVEVLAPRDRGPILDIFKEHGGGRLDSVRQALQSVDGFSVAEFVKRCRSGAEAVRDRYGITPSQASRVAAAPEAVLMLIEEVDLEPTTVVRLNTAAPGSAAQWRGFEHLSKGQKATAVLLLLLLNTEGPLLVDQPEDDLDNRFISEDIIPRIREGKRKRQFIFCTHNANIPVLADAELILGLTPVGQEDDAGARIRREHMGSIDERSVKELVEELLEGGKTAFETRRRKYGF